MAAQAALDVLNIASELPTLEMLSVRFGIDRRRDGGRHSHRCCAFNDALQNAHRNAEAGSHRLRQITFNKTRVEGVDLMIPPLLATSLTIDGHLGIEVDGELTWVEQPARAGRIARVGDEMPGFYRLWP